MSQTLTYVIGQDRRPHVDNVQDFKVNFDGSNTNWVQARQYERSMRQVFVNIKNEDGTPLDLTGCNVWFEGLLPKNSAGDFRIIDDKGYVALDPTAGRFRFDMPGHAFTVAGSYRQAFFRILKDGNSITTLEFDLDVLADKVIDGLVPRTYISPVEELINEIEAKYQDSTDKLTKMTSDFVDKFTQSMNTLKALGATVQNGLDALEQKIKQDGLFTQAEADAFKQSIEDSVTNKLSDFQNVYKNDVAKMNSYIEELNQSDYRVIPYKMVSGTVDPIGANTISENQIEHLAKIGASLALIDMVNITSATDANPTKSDGQAMQRTVDLCKKHNVAVKMLKPHLGVNWSDNFYRADYNPSDVETAMENWGNILASYADFCNANNIPILCIECEQYILTQNKYLQYWTDIINRIKQKYPDLKLTVAYMGFEIVDPEHKDLLRQIDIIGLNLYPGFFIDDYSESLSVQYLVRSFYNSMNGTNAAEVIDQVCDEFRKPAMLTETGCIATTKGLSKLVPSDYDANKGANHYEVTAYMMKAIFRFLQEDRNIIGFAWWHLNKPFNFFDGSSSTDNLSIAERTFKDYVERKLI